MERQIIKKFSLKICEVMEDIGVTEEMVNFRRYFYLQYDRPGFDKDMPDYYYRVIGSQVEGSTTLGMNSDHDTIIVSQYMKVILHGQSTEITEGGQLAALFVKDDMCCSQCCFLQVGPIGSETELEITCSDGTDITGQFFCDKQGRRLLSNKPEIDSLARWLKLSTLNVEQHGPALKCSLNDVIQRDNTLALYCPSLPDDCQVLFTRPKPGHWPKQQTLTNAKQCELFLVHPGNMGSTYDRRNSTLKINFTFEFSLCQWRMSTNMIERLLMFDLNIVQMRAYILTKMIRKEFLGPIVDNRLSTFHMKTSLLFTIEQFPENIWSNDNLVQCVMYCLNTLRRFLKRRFCPHYTIASVNLFENKLEVFEMNKLEKHISSLISSILEFIGMIQMDNFGQRLLCGINSSTKEETCSLIIWQSLFITFRQWSSEIDSEATKSRNAIDDFFNTNFEEALFVSANDNKYPYERQDQLNDICNEIASVEASRSIKNDIVISDDIHEMFRLSLRSRNISCYLKYASMLVCTQQYEKAEQLLKEVYITPYMVEVSPYLVDLEKFGSRIKLTNSNSPSYIVMDCLRKMLAPVSFSREESHCLPKHVVYEMYRRDTKSEYGKMLNERWKDTAVINARPFLYYLQYLSSKNTHTKQEPVRNMEKYLTDKLDGTDNFNSHKETTLNILGHIYELENNISAAWTTYAKSVFYVPINNAALWHLFRLLGQHVYGKKAVSLKICEVMEDIGVTEEMVNFRRYFYLQYDRPGFDKDMPYYYYRVIGSQVEGSTTLGMNSDYDTIIVSQYMKVILHGQSTEITEGGQLAALFVKDDMCCSQCCFLQVGPIGSETELEITCSDGTDITGQFFCDKQGRRLLSNKPEIDSLARWLKLSTLNVEQHGPALKCSLNDVIQRDNTLALYCPSLPDDCQVLFTRPKPGHWPKQQTLTNAKQCEVFLVHPGNMGSTYDRRNSTLKINFTFEFSLCQWRMSTNMIERLLMFDLNIVQMRAYILTKMIRKEFLGPIVDNRLSTFHMKTSLLFTIEQFPENIWSNDNLVQCVMYCLNTLRRFLKRRFCPHYTIASVNLFENKLEVFEMNKLEKHISSLISSILEFIGMIQMDNFGQRLLCGINSSTKEETCSLIIWQSLFITFRQWSSEIDSEATKSRNAIDDFFNTNFEEALFVSANDNKYPYERQDQLNDICNEIASVEASRSIKNDIVISDDIHEMFRLSLRSRNISCYLKYASMLVCTQQYEKAEQLLKEVYITPYMVEVSPYLVDLEKFGSRIKLTNSNSPSYIVMDCLRKMLAPVSFSREESHCLPKHVVYEMYRRDTKSEYGKMLNERWKDTAVINARPFLYYLQYLSSKNTHTKQEPVRNMEKYLTDKLDGTDNFNSHKETTLNILGHIYELENNISAAWTTYAKSVFYVPINNAALWHLFRLLGQHVYGKKGDIP
ncbi:hypothetical protein DPMN_102961 [Dreissena polymorpha]|uniref:Mab-21-like HhH/H2TH-like domain-containing protein n=1 Tax=Dreissena polymorpha TaxID=45954 RepID=A0A9D4H717_DREPO|nr:hypothetical protein DPMN_102961 [Dreissena polymorpha]